MPELNLHSQTAELQPEQVPAVPDQQLQLQQLQGADRRAFWLTDAKFDIDRESTVVDPAQLGLRAKKGETVLVPAVFQMPNQEGGMDEFALVRRVGVHGAKLALHGLVRAGDHLRASRRGLKLEIPPESQDGTPQSLTQVRVGNGAGAITRSELFGRRLIRKNKKLPGFATDGELDLMITPQGGVYATNTADGKVVGMQAHTSEPLGRVSGSVRIDPLTDERHANYITPEERSRRYEEEQRAREAEKARAEEQSRQYEIERTQEIYAPKIVPDTTKGELFSGEGLVVTAKTREYSRHWLRNAFAHDPQAVELVEKAFGRYPVVGTDEAADAVMDFIRSDKDTRLALGELFAARVYAVLHLMEGGIRKTEYKTPNFPGIYKGPKLRHTEYAAVLALAHLDGTFNPDTEHHVYKPGQPGEVNEFGWPKYDQHRAAARFALDGMEVQQRDEWNARQAELRRLQAELAARRASEPDDVLYV